jgi:DNA-binding MarR family transcriptional regulator
MRPQRPAEEEILIWCGVVSQLVRTRSNQLLKDAGLPYPLFILLRHFCHDPDREWTISSLTAAFETGQSGMTKQVQRLLDLGYLATRNDPVDARIKWLRVTATGQKLRDELMAKLAPDQNSYFSNWTAAEIQNLHGLLERLKTYLDDHRTDLIWPE